jgi:hypothetical protein
MVEMAAFFTSIRRVSNAAFRDSCTAQTDIEIAVNDKTMEATSARVIGAFFMG